MNQIKLSILSPCYNGEKYIEKYFKNILEQTFNEYEVIIVNDGSKDNSDSIIRKYKKIFEDKGITFKYLNKPQNEGHAKAISDGLKLVTGKYLMWPDIDDYMHEDHLEKHVQYMENNEDVDLCIGKSAVYNVNDLLTPLFYAWNYFPKDKKSLIKDFMLSEKQNVGFMSGTFILKTEFLWSVYPKKDIYSQISVGPTIQMVFPAVYLGKVGYLSECTFDYYIHGNNQHLVNELNQYKKIKLVYDNVLDDIGIVGKESEKLKKRATNVSDRMVFCYAFRNNDLLMAKQAWKNLKSNNGIRFKEWVKYIILNIKPINVIFFKLKGK